MLYIRKMSLIVGSGGKRLSIAQRQKLALARALIKRPDLPVVNRALTALGMDGQRRVIDDVLRKAAGEDGHRFGIVWVLANAELADYYQNRIKEHDKFYNRVYNNYYS